MHGRDPPCMEAAVEQQSGVEAALWVDQVRLVGREDQCPDRHILCWAVLCRACGQVLVEHVTVERVRTVAPDALDAHQCHHHGRHLRVV